MIKKLFFAIILYSSLFGQERVSGLFLETIMMPSSRGISCNISFKIPYNRLIFEKVEDKFRTNFSLSFEAIDSLSGNIVREISTHQFTVNSYEETKLNDKFYESYEVLDLLPGSYRVFPVFTNENTGMQYYLQNLYITTDSIKYFYDPVIVYSEQIVCNNNASFVLANFEGNIPFSSSDFDLILPVSDTTIDSIHVELINNEKSVFKENIKEHKIEALELNKCNGDVVLKNGNHVKSNNFVIRRFNTKLEEGSLEIRILNGEKTKIFSRSVKWYNKPFSLNDILISTRLIKYVTDDPEVLKKFRFLNEKSAAAFNDLWKKMDPTPETVFNELLAEFYTRADYTIRNFSPVNVRNGAETDRGRIYIQFGKPDNIERSYSDSKFTREVWYYKNPNLKFIFSDKSGLGNFVLENKPL